MTIPDHALCKAYQVLSNDTMAGSFSVVLYKKLAFEDNVMLQHPVAQCKEKAPNAQVARTP